VATARPLKAFHHPGDRGRAPIQPT
jgi:hypothetical protein